MAKKRDLTQRQTFEEQGEIWARHLLHTTENKDDKAQALAWLEERRIEREEEAASKRDAREEETLSIAKEANRIASETAASVSRQARWAKRAVIIAAIAMIIAAMGAAISIITNKVEILGFIKNLNK